MRVPLRLPVRRAGRETLAVLLIALGATLLAALLRWSWPLSGTFDRLDNLIYDSLYRARRWEDQTRDSDVVIVAIDEKSIEAMNRSRQYGWPWPREFWGILAQYAGRCGARAVVFDLIFSEKSVYQNELGDDDNFAKLIGSSGIPVAFAVHVDEHQPNGRFAPPITNPILGAANIPEEFVLRSYRPFVDGAPSLAVRAVEISGLAHANWRDPFLLHYYGPHATGEGRPTFLQVPAATMIADALQSGPGTRPRIDPEVLRNKIVLVGATFGGGFDVKASPLSDQYPGVEYHATAVQNLLRGQRVIPLSVPLAMAIAFVASLAAASGGIAPRRAVTKGLLVALCIVALVGIAIFLFRSSQIRWLALAMPLLATIFATAGAFQWAYFTEARQRRFILKALAQYVSPAVANELAADPSKLALGGQRRDMSVMFTDITGFTPLSESLPVEKVSALLNCYFGEMTDVIFRYDGTLNKYLGDAIMSFWNAPLNQPDHAIRACRAALDLQRRGQAIRKELAKFGAPDGLVTRIGINSGQMLVGNMGSTWKFDYTVVGDAVNYAARLESANRFYDTRILLSESTAKLVAAHFALRKLDLLKVKGHSAAASVYELLGEAPADEALRRRIDAYEKSLELYQARQWQSAREILVEILREFAQDGAARMLLERIEAFQISPPPADWDGSFNPGK